MCKQIHILHEALRPNHVINLRLLNHPNSCHAISTKVEFTVFPVGRTFSVSSSGGGLFGRPDP